MTVTWLGHSCFCLESGGYRVVLDPYFVETYPALRVRAHKTLCSHTHRDHCFTEAVERISDGKKDPFTVETLSTFHDEKGGVLRGDNTVHILSAEGLRVVHCGDLGHELGAEQAEKLRGCDVLLIPVGGYYTIDAKTAKRVVDAVQPRAVVPMHYRFGSHGYDVIETVEPFLSTFAGNTVQRLSGNSFTPTKDAPRGVIVPKFEE